ncbi:MAG: DUF4340 domain-containing protein [Pseudomonadota bacterium]|nr:DUF4340 domain-containing protein [Pseudomonadota bacterium]
MNSRRFVCLLTAAVLAISAALYLSTQRSLPRDPKGTAFLPYLAREMNGVSELSIRKGGLTPTVTVQKHADQWTVKQRADYPADITKLRKLLLALNDAKIVEEKTANPASFPIIGVEDPASAGAAGSEIDIIVANGSHAVIVGKPVGDGNFARRGGENQSYSIEPAIVFEAEPRYWIDNRLTDLAAANIQSIEVKPAGGPAYIVHRSGPGSAPFLLDGVPAGRKPADATALAPSPTAYGAITAEDVAAASSIDFGKPTVAAVTMSDGSVVTLTGAVSGDRHWVRIESSKDAALNSKATGRAFELTGYRYDAIFRPLEQLLMPKDLPSAAKKSAPAVSPLPAPAKKALPAPHS